jgi:hypothetical protein
MHEPTPVTQNEYGDDTHPAFGSIKASRVTSNGTTLFDSEIQHSEFIRVTLAPMTRKRDLNRDWLHTTNPTLVEVDMSLAQWGAFVSSMGTSGVPCTIRALPGDYDLPGLDIDQRLAISANETKEAARKAFHQIKTAMDDLEALPSSAGVKARRAAMSRLHAAIQNAPANVEFASKSLTEHTENVVQKARADIEAMIERHAEQIGLDAPDAMAAISGPQAAAARRADNLRQAEHAIESLGTHPRSPITEEN